MTEVITNNVVATEGDLNRDPISGTKGAHPLGTGAGWHDVRPAARAAWNRADLHWQVAQ